MKTLDDTGIWIDSENEVQPCVVRSSRWPHIALRVTTTNQNSMGAWAQSSGAARLEEVATTLQRLGTSVVYSPDRTRITLVYERIKGRWSGWRNASAHAQTRCDGFANADSVLASTLEVLSDTMPRYAQWLASKISNDDERLILEVGAGTGTMTRVLAKQRKVVAFEPSPDARQELIQQTSSISNIRIAQSLEECSDLGPYDSIVLVNVLEHIESDVYFLSELKALVRSSGRVVVLSPAHNCLYSDFDASIGHVRRYTRRQLKRTFQCAGYTTADVRYFNAVGAVVWLLVNRLLKRKAATTSQTRLYDTVVVPVSALVDRLGCRPFGQSVIGVARPN